MNTLNISTYVAPISLKSGYTANIEYCLGNISDDQIRSLISDPTKLIMVFVPYSSVLRVHLDILTRLLNSKKFVDNQIALFSIPVEPKDKYYRDTVANIVEMYYQQHINIDEIWDPSVGSDLGQLV